MKKQRNFCQSCGMPLDKDPQGGGTNADGSLSDRYCSYCWQGGAFTVENVSVKEFQEICRKAMIESGKHPVVAWLFSRGYSRLERWKSSAHK